MLGGKYISRRQAVAAFGATGLTLIGADSSVWAQPETKMDPKSFLAKQVSSNFYLTKVAVEEAHKFPMGKKIVALKLETAAKECPPYAIVKDFELEPKLAQKLGRKVNIIESVVCGITDRDSIDAVKDRLAHLKVPREIRERSIFYFGVARRRDVDPKDKDALALAHDFNKYKGQLSYVLAVSEKDKKTQVTILLAGHKGAVVLPAASGTSGGASKPTPHPDPEQPMNEDLQCLVDCVEKMAIVLAAVGVLCSGCAAAVTACLLPGAAPITLPLALGLCAFCLVGAVAIMHECQEVCLAHK